MSESLGNGRPLLRATTAKPSPARQAYLSYKDFHGPLPRGHPSTVLRVQRLLAFENTTAIFLHFES